MLRDLLHDSASAASETQDPSVCQTYEGIIYTGSARPSVVVTYVVIKTRVLGSAVSKNKSGSLLPSAK